MTDSYEPRLRLARAADIAELDRLIESSMRGLVGRLYNERQVEGALGPLVGVDTRLIADGTYYVAVAGREIVGCGGWSMRGTLYGGDGARAGAEQHHGHHGDAAPLLDPATDAARIRAFFVRPDWARRGIGRRILRASERAARRRGFSRFELVAILTGVPLYAACGYRDAGPIELPLPDGGTFPCLRMEKAVR
jgi:GNAT superfamily N-acetyltransferase